VEEHHRQQLIDGCTTSVEGKVSGNNSRIHLGEEEKKPVTRGRGREEF
jgi:hypothetical protein